MSIPRYTCAESALTISTGKHCASCSASALLPDAVGPMSSTAGSAFARSITRTCGRERAAHTLAASLEQAVEIGERELIPRRSTMIALARALGGFHLAQQGIHLGDRQ